MAIEKAVILGPSGVGKTAVFERLVDQFVIHIARSSGDFSWTQDCSEVTVLLGDQKRRIQLKNTPSGEATEVYSAGFAKDASQLVLVWNAEDPETLNELEKYLEQIHRDGPITPDTRVIFVRNKIDKVNGDPISQQQRAIIARFVEKYGIKHHQLSNTSAKFNEEEGIETLRSDICEPIRKSEQAAPPMVASKQQLRPTSSCAFFKKPATQAIGGVLIAAAGATLVGGSKALAAWLCLQLLATTAVPPIAVATLIAIGILLAAAGIANVGIGACREFLPQ